MLTDACQQREHRTHSASFCTPSQVTHEALASCAQCGLCSDQEDARREYRIRGARRLQNGPGLNVQRYTQTGCQRGGARIFVAFRCEVYSAPTTFEPDSGAASSRQNLLAAPATRQRGSGLQPARDDRIRICGMRRVGAAEPKVDYQRVPLHCSALLRSRGAQGRTATLNGRSRLYAVS